MNILLFLIPLSLVLLVAAAWAFMWAVRRGQFDDMDTPGLDILRDDPHERPRQAAPPPVSEESGEIDGAGSGEGLKDRDAHAD